MTLVLHRSCRIFAPGLALAGLLCSAGKAQAQLALHVTGQFAVVSEYLDRGVILTNQPVLQPSVAVALPAGGGTATIGIWATVQPASYTGTQYFSMAPGEKSPNVTEARPSLELSQPLGVARVAFKATMRMFPNTVGLTKAANTFDVASTVQMTRLPLAPGLMVAYDIGAINGAYLEGRVGQRLPMAKGFALELSGKTGYAIRQMVDSAPDVFAPYQRNGFTHVDLTAAAVVTVAGAAIQPYLTYTIVPNPLDSPLAPGRQDRRTLVFGTSVTLAGTFPKAKK